ncbi:ankyrin repeat, PH and SEC7 domain containing protein secG-like [Actinia tenebrosa]|uniref:Ankyrin repeat, PH and SEC7 domain containing protein secG-like n=1 Tax=Actinia tenebrosa TaxID=6105 RepID=A0A6P8HUE1_ACTTE|nr:ankyrin repeat, PH and SEC7 domain containing protein secG-like [Actinia tenebrosa]
MDMLLASEIGDNKKLEQLLVAENLDVNYSNDSKETPLLLACKFEHSSCCSLLLEAGASVDQSDCVGNSPLHFARDHKTVVRLLELGADPAAKNVKGRTSLHEAALWGAIDGFKALLREFTNRKLSVDVLDDQEFTPLHLAVISDVEENILEKISLLVSAGAKIDKPSLHGSTSLSLACFNHNLKASTVLHLLRYGASPHVVDKYGNTCLHAIFKFNPDFYPFEQESLEVILQELVKLGCDVNITNRNGQTALHYAAYSAFLKPVKILLESGADPLIVDHIGRTPLHKSMYNIDFNVVEVLLEYSKCPCPVDHLGGMPLHHAAASGTPKIVSTITKAMSSSPQGIENFINKPDNTGMTPLHYFLLYKRTDESILKCLLQHGANVNIGLPSGVKCIDMARYAKDVSKVIFQADNKIHPFPLQELPALQELPGSQEKSNLNDYLQPICIDSDRDIDTKTLRPTQHVQEYLDQICLLTIPSEDRIKLLNCMNSSIEKFVRNLCDEIARMDPRFASNVLPSGSTYEGTKPLTEANSVRDFDYMICLGRLSEEVIVEEAEPAIVGHVKLAHKQPKNQSKFKEFFSDGYLVGDRVLKAFGDLMVLVMNQPKIWQDGEMECPCIPTLESTTGHPNIEVKSLWPSFARQESSILTPETRQCHVVLKQPDTALYSTQTFGNPAHLLRVSFSVAEREIFHKMPEVVKKSCVVAKVLSRRTAKVPLSMIYGGEYGKAKMKILTKNTFSSYVLKTALFHELEALCVNDNNISTNNELALKPLVCGIFRRLSQAAGEGFLPSFFVPRQNLFHTFREDSYNEKIRYLTVQLLNISLEDGDRKLTVQNKSFSEKRNNDILAKKHRKSLSILKKLGADWIN